MVKVASFEAAPEIEPVLYVVALKYHCPDESPRTV
jgi:hypothetical protein